MAGDVTLERLRYLADLGRHADARAGLATLLASEPDNVDALLLFSDVLDELGDTQGALDAALAAARLDPDDEQVQICCSDALIRAKRHPEAVAAAQEAVRLAPHSWRAHYTLGRALLGGRRPNARAALESANEAVRLAPMVSHGHNLAGLCLDRLMLPREAERAFTEAVRLDPTNATALANLSATHLEGGRLRDASHLVTAGLSVDAQKSQLHLLYDFILVKLMRRFFWTEVGCGVLIAILAGSGAAWFWRALTGVTMLALFAWFTRDIFRRLPRGSHAHVRGLLGRSHGWTRYAIALFLVTTPAVLTMAFSPAPVALGVGLALLVIFRFLGIGVIVIGFGSLLRGLLPGRRKDS